MSQVRVIHSAPDAVVLAVSGEVDLANASQLLDAGSDSFAQDSTRLVIVDLSDVTFMDSTALSALISLRNTAIRLTKQLQLRNVPQRVWQLLSITKLDGVFSIVEDRAVNPD
jgi:anti-sigma B factor antagonist